MLASGRETYTREDFLNDVYIEESDLNKIEYLARKKRNIILQGAPGTGKSFTALKLAKLITGNDAEDNPRIEFIQFHSQSSYENYIYGWRRGPDGSLHQRPGGFVRFCEIAAKDKDHLYVYIIDEINRADLGKVFGVVSMAIETEHRNRMLPLPFDELDEVGNPTGRDIMFCVPSNVIIIGIINTADRELTSIDYSLRRRFAFYTMQPAFHLESGQLKLNSRFAREVSRFNEPDGSNMLLTLINNVAALNKEMAADKLKFGSSFCIGHSYFCNLDSDNPSTALSQVIDFELKPLVEEYCFHDSTTARRWTNILMRNMRL